MGGFVLTALATCLTLAKLRGNPKKAMQLPLVVPQHECSHEGTDAGLLGDEGAQEGCILVLDAGADGAKEEPASPQKPMAREHTLPAPELDSVASEDFTWRRTKSEQVGCFNMQGMFNKSRKKRGVSLDAV